jgi:broad specificity phosphatase PhoE
VRMKELNEVDFGEWEMKSIKDVEKSHQDLLKDRKRDMWGVRPPGGESYGQARDRLMPVIESLMKRYEGETFAVVAHGALLKIVHSCLLGVPIQRFYGMSFPFLGAFFFKKEGNKIRLEKEWL